MRSLVSFSTFELDTITDFISYLREKQTKLSNVHFTGNGGRDLLTLFIQ
jgi:hypothetical protein